MVAKSGQRFIKENRAPRVHIEYEVETYGSRQKIELPFVMGVLSDLSGKSHVEKKELSKRDFVEIDMDNFDERMEAIAPRAAFTVENTLTGEGKLGVDLTFKTINDFTPGEIVKALDQPAGGERDMAHADVRAVRSVHKLQKAHDVIEIIKRLAYAHEHDV